MTGSKFEQTLTLYEQAREFFPGRYRELLRLRPPAVLKVNLRNEYPRCYVTRRIRADEGFYFGPFASRRSAEAFSEGFLDLFKIRRCQIKIRRDPNFPGCIYSEMKMCLAPCFAGCTKEEYDAEVGAGRSKRSIPAGGALTAKFEREREAASEALDFERAAALHKRLEKVAAALRGLAGTCAANRRTGRRDPSARGRRENHRRISVTRRSARRADIPAISPNFRASRARWRRSCAQALQPQRRSGVAPRESQAKPSPDAGDPSADSTRRYGLHDAPAELPEHLSLVARWFYSKPREGEILFREDDWPYRRILRACSRLLALPALPSPPNRRRIPERNRGASNHEPCQRAIASYNSRIWRKRTQQTLPRRDLASVRDSSDMVRSLKHRNFQLFFSGQMISLIGTWMDNIAEAWLVYRLTGSSLLLGTVAFAGQIPVFLLAPVGGMVADRWNRRKIVIATQVASMILAFILAFLTLTKRVTVWEVIVLAALMGVVNAFDIPARQAFLVEMVGREDLMNAIALNSSMFNGARIIGPAIAGILVASIGEGWCFFANAVSYIAVIAGLLMMRIARATAVDAPRVALRTHRRRISLRARHGADPRALLLLGAREPRGDAVHGADADFRGEILHGNARTLGVLMGATGVGALIGALMLRRARKCKDWASWSPSPAARSAFA